MSELHPPPLNAPLIDMRTGYVTRPWAQWFEQSLFVRVGGMIAPTNTDLEELATLDPFTAQVPVPASEPGDPFGLVVAPMSQNMSHDLRDVFGQPPLPVHDPYNETDTLMARLIALEARVAVLEALGGFS